jgi:hypothetical protein
VFTTLPARLLHETEVEFAFPSKISQNPSAQYNIRKYSILCTKIKRIVSRD